MVAYKLSKNGLVVPFFVIFRLAGEKLLVTVALDHPVVTDFADQCVFLKSGRCRFLRKRKSCSMRVGL